MSGTYVDKHVPRAVLWAFLAVSLAVAVVPAVGMLWARTDTTTENRELAPAPSLMNEDGSFNVNVLADAGDYFDDHFAYRNQAVTLNARMRTLLGTSATDQVIVGSDDWLYYAGTLNDYLGRSALSDRSLANIAHNLKLVQGYVESKGASFAFTVAPNKNTLYDENMPSFYVRCPDPSNAERLKPLLDQAGVNYVDLFSLLESQDDVLYLKRDTHWDNRGALLASNAIMQALGRDALSVDPSTAVEIDDFVGDLQSMLYPGDNRTEPNYYFAGYHDQLASSSPLMWQFQSGSDVTDNQVQTAGLGRGTLLMFRDSFGNALVPYFAASFGQAMFSKLVPYNMPLMTQVKADSVVIERAERHLSDLATAPPILPNPTVKFQGGLPDGAREVRASLEYRVDGSYWVVGGTVDEQLQSEDRLYLVVLQDGSAPVVYDPYWTSSADESGEVTDDCGLLAYIPTSSIDLESAALRVYVK